MASEVESVGDNPRAGRGLPTVEQMWGFFEGGGIGTKEFRNWLAKVDPVFAEVRDEDVDQEIENLAKLRQEQIQRSRDLLEEERQADQIEGE